MWRRLVKPIDNWWHNWRCLDSSLLFERLRKLYKVVLDVEATVPFLSRNIIKNIRAIV
jgi:hypothetical protein